VAFQPAHSTPHPPQKTICGIGGLVPCCSFDGTSLPRKNNQPAAFLASFNAMSRKNNHTPVVWFHVCSSVGNVCFFDATSLKNQPAALLASFNATSKKGINKQHWCLALPFQQHWQCCLLQCCIPPKNNQPAAFLASFDATSRKKSTCGIGGLVPCFQWHCQWCLL